MKPENIFAFFSQRQGERRTLSADGSFLINFDMLCSNVRRLHFNEIEIGFGFKISHVGGLC